MTNKKIREDNIKYDRRWLKHKRLSPSIFEQRTSKQTVATHLFLQCKGYTFKNIKMSKNWRRKVLDLDRAAFKYRFHAYLRVESKRFSYASTSSNAQLFYSDGHSIVEFLHLLWAHYFCHFSEALFYEVTIRERFPVLPYEFSYLVAGYCNIFLSFVSTGKILLLSQQASCHLLNIISSPYASVGRVGLMFGFMVSSYIILFYPCNSLIANQTDTLPLDFYVELRSTIQSSANFMCGPYSIIFF